MSNNKITTEIYPQSSGPLKHYERMAYDCIDATTSATSDRADRKNDGKPQLTLLPFDCLVECTKVMMQAQAKYPNQANGKANWEKLWGRDTPKVVLDSALRHIAAILSGEVRDKESGQLHAAHAAVNLLFLIRYELEEAKK